MGGRAEGWERRSNSKEKLKQTTDLVRVSGIESREASLDEKMDGRERQSLMKMGVAWRRCDGAEDVRTDCVSRERG